MSKKDEKGEVIMFRKIMGRKEKLDQVNSTGREGRKVKTKKKTEGEDRGGERRQRQRRRRKKTEKERKEG